MSRESPTETASVGTQVDIPFPIFYGNRDEAVYRRNKFRPEEIDRYGGETSGVPTSTDYKAEKVSREKPIGVQEESRTSQDNEVMINRYEELSSDESLSIMEPSPEVERDSSLSISIKEERLAARKARIKNQRICKREEEEKRAKKNAARARSRARTTSATTEENSVAGKSPDPELTGSMRPAGALQHASGISSETEKKPM